MRRECKKWVARVLLCVLCCLMPAGTVGEEAWNIPESIALSQEQETLFTEAMEGLLGVSYVPLAYLGGMPETEMHCFLCTGTIIYPGQMPAYKLVYVSSSQGEDARIVKIQDLDLAALLRGE